MKGLGTLEKNFIILEGSFEAEVLMNTSSLNHLFIGFYMVLPCCPCKQKELTAVYYNGCL